MRKGDNKEREREERRKERDVKRKKEDENICIDFCRKRTMLFGEK